jgi:hypothetical protein
MGHELYIDPPDSAAFDATTYYEDLISKASLKELMQRASSLAAGQLRPPLQYSGLNLERLSG